MTISTYAELLTAVQNFAHRTDLSSVIGDLFTRAEAGLNRKLKLLQQEQRTIIQTVQNNRFAALPDGCLEVISVRLDTGGGSLRRLTKFPAEVIDQDLDLNSPGIPYFYRVGNDQLEFDLPADAVYDVHLHWYRKWSLETDGSNWLLTNHPDLYMDAVLEQVGLYTRDGEMVAAAKANVLEQVNELVYRDSKARDNVKVGIDDGLLGAETFDINRG